MNEDKVKFNDDLSFTSAKKEAEWNSLSSEDKNYVINHILEISEKLPSDFDKTRVFQILVCLQSRINELEKRIDDLGVK